MHTRVVALRRYPVKSMGGEPLHVAELDRRGLVGDRGYAVVAHPDGRVVRDRAEVGADDLLRVLVAHGDFGVRVIGRA